MNLKNKIIVFDTNIYLNLYRFSPDYANFMLEVMMSLKSSIVVPGVIYCEFKRNNKSLFSIRKKSIEATLDESIKLLNTQKVALTNSFNRFVQGKFPDANSCLSEITAKYDESISIIQDYFSNHSVLDFIKDSWNGDEPDAFLSTLKKEGKVLPDLSLEEIYRLCDEAEKRFKNKIPPGFKDEKNKNGIRAYSDYLWWKEVLSYCKDKHLDLVIVTDDAKIDWWEEDSSSLRKELVAEFKKASRYLDSFGKPIEQELIGYTAKEFFETYASDNKIQIPDAIDIFTNMTDDEYVGSIEDRVFTKIVYKLSYSRDNYLDIETFDHIGDEEIEDWDIDSKELIEYETERVENTIFYYLKYNVEMSTRSYDYWGRDDDTREVIKSDSYEHSAEGEVIVEIRRNMGFCMDENDDSFEGALIKEASFKQTNYINNNYEREDESCYENTCPICGEELTFENDAGNGFCVHCSKKEDFDK